MDLVAHVALSVMWLVILLRLPSLRGPAQQRAITLMFVFFALSGTLVIRDVRYAVDAAVGVPDLAILLGYLSGMAGVVAALQFGITAAASKRVIIRNAQVFLTAAGAAMVALFLVIPRRLDQPDFGYWHARHPAVVAYQLLDQVCFTTALVIAVVTLFPARKAASRGPLRTALSLLLLGAVLGLGYNGCRLWYVVAHGFGLVERLDRPVYGLVTFTLLYASLLAAAVGGLIRGTYKWLDYLRRATAYRRLRGLWAELVEAVPSVVLQRPPRVFPARLLELRLYRRTVEIRDAQLELIGHVSPRLREAARTALHDAGIDDALALDACALRIALALKRTGVVEPEDAAQVSWSSAASLDEEVAGLLELDRLMRDPEVGRAATAALDAVLSASHHPG